MSLTRKQKPAVKDTEARKGKARAEEKKPRKPREKKPRAPKIGAEYFLPSIGSLGKGGEAIGCALRALLSSLLSASLVHFLCDSFGIIAPGRWAVYAVSLLLGALFALMAHRPLFYWIGLASLLLGGAGALVACGNPIDILVGMVPKAWNTAMETLENADFRTFPALKVESTGIGDGTLLSAFQLILLLTVSIPIFASVYRRVRLIPILVCCTFTMLPVLTYNFACSVLDFSIIVVTLTGVLVLRHYDRALKKEPIGGHKSAMGGYMGAGAALLAAVAIVLPAATVKEQWKPIRGINETMEIARTVLSSVLIGEKPDWTQVGNMGNMDSLGNRSTLASHRQFTGRDILKVYTGINLPVYLRSWIGYSFSEDSWRTANGAEQQLWYDLFGKEFDPEQVSNAFYELALPEGITFDPEDDYENNMEYGFLSTLVSVDVLSSSGNLLYLPARFDPSHGFLGFAGNRDAAGKPYTGRTDRYFDGLITTDWLNLNKRYSVVAHLPTWRDATAGANLSALALVYDANRDAISRYYNQVISTQYMTREEFLAYYGDINDPANGIDFSAFYQFLDMTPDEQVDYYQRVIALPEKYDRYVRNHYVTSSGSEQIRALARQLLAEKVLPELYGEDVPPMIDIILPERGEDLPVGDIILPDGIDGGSLFPSPSYSNYDRAVLRTHLCVMAVVDYLRENCTYTLTPKEGNGDLYHRDYDSVETFLFLTKEGYCVQFATAATMLLREMGVPTRYVEGYLLSELEYDRDSEGRFQKYKGLVEDNDAHAWIEVWQEGIGWMTYEATAPFYDAMYKPLTSSPVTPEPQPPVTLPPQDTLPDEPIVPLPPVGTDPSPFLGLTGAQWWMVIGILLCAAALVSAVLVIRAALVRRGRRLRDKREKLALALSGRVNEAEALAIGEFLADCIDQTCLAGGVTRRRNEFPMEYAARIDASLAALKNPPILRHSFTEAVALMEQVRYGRRLRAEELTVLAEFWVSLRDRVRERFHPLENFWYGTVKEMV